ncbi:MAG: hypothetical protein IT242_10560 [Bacteroidia bacterium]|nr:hypothetical protein [Bacteroidia bacterium]
MKPKIRQIFEKLDGHDINRLEKYLESPFFNENQDVLALYKFISQRSRTENEWPENAEIYSGIFPDKKYDDKHYRYLVSFLTRHIENYLVLTHLFHQPREWLRHKQKALLERQTRKAYEYQKGELEASLREGPQDAMVHFFRHEMELRQLEYDAVHQTRKSVISFAGVMDELDRFYISKKLQVACEILNARNVQAENYVIHFLEEAKQAAQRQEFSGIPAIQIYLSVLNTLTDDSNHSYFRELKELVIEKGSLFPLSEQNELFQYLKNYCVKQINTGRQDFMKELFGIYKINLENKRLMRLEGLSPWEYKNIVTIGLRLGEAVWVKNFIRDYNTYITPEHRKNAEIYNTANWYFHKGDFKMALKMFMEVEFTDLYYQLDVRALQLKAYYELGDEETLFYHGSAFRTFLSRNRLVSDYQRKIYRNLIRFTTRLVRCGTQPGKLSALLKEVRSVKQIADYRWLEEKVRIMAEA